MCSSIVVILVLNSNFQALLKLVVGPDPKISSFHSSWAAGHNSTNYARYYSIPPGENEIYPVTRYQSAYEPYVITSKYVPWSVDIQQKVLTLKIQLHAVGVMNVSQAMVRTRLPVCLKCISAAYLFSSCLSISSSTRVISMKSRPGVKKYALFLLFYTYTNRILFRENIIASCT